MEMELGNAIIGVISIIICILPFVLMGRSRKKREKKILRSLSEISSLNHCQIDQHEVFGSFAIGIDNTKNFVFFYRLTKAGEVKQLIDLSEIQSCKVINSGVTFKNKEGNQKAIDRLELACIPTARNKPEIKMEFYNADVNGQLNGELQSIDKWSKLINERLKHK